MYKNVISLVVVIVFVLIALGSGGNQKNYTYTPPENKVVAENLTNITLVEFNPSNLVVSSNDMLLKKIIYSWYTDSYELSGATIIKNDSIVFNISLTRSSVGNSPVVFAFQIENNSDQIIKVKWDEVSYIDNDGVAHPIIKTGVRLVERDQPTKAVVIPPHSKVDEILQPSDYIEYSGDWYSRPVLESLDDNQKVKIFMPIDIGGNVTNYTFTFASKVRKTGSENQCGPDTYKFYSTEKNSVVCVNRDTGVRCKNNEKLTFDSNKGYWTCPSGE
jgi:hypothetical protein